MTGTVLTPGDMRHPTNLEVLVGEGPQHQVLGRERNGPVASAAEVRDLLALCLAAQTPRDMCQESTAVTFKKGLASQSAPLRACACCMPDDSLALGRTASTPRCQRRGPRTSRLLRPREQSLRRRSVGSATCSARMPGATTGRKEWQPERTCQGKHDEHERAPPAQSWATHVRGASV